MPDLNLDPNTLDPDYMISDDQRVVYVLNQNIRMKRPAHLTSLVIHLLPSGGGAPVLLVSGVDYVIGQANYDYDAMGRAYLSDPTFSGIVISGITMKKVVSPNYVITMTYTTLDMDGALFDPDNNGPDPSPQLMGYFLERIAELDAKYNPITNVNATLLDPLRCLPMDLTGVHMDNWIVDERHYVNTMHSEQIIRPAAGSFYRHELRIIVDTTGTQLIQGQDYIVFGVDVPRTRASHHNSGVYDFICITNRAIQGVLRVSYHAYGGEISHMDGQEIKKILGNILHYLSQLRGGSGEGGDGLCACLGDIRSIFHVTSANTDYHWLTIGQLYRDPNLFIMRKGVGIFRAYGDTNTKFDIMFQVDVNLDNVASPVKLKLLSGMNPIDWSSDTYPETLDQQIVPRVRVIGRTDIDSGVLLQLGFPIRSGNAVITVENRSTRASQWSLRDSASIAAFGSVDVTATLPSGDSWTHLSANNLMYDRAMGYVDGIVLFNGYFELGVPDEDRQTIISPVLFENFYWALPVKGFQKFEFEFYDRYTGNFLRSEGLARANWTSSNKTTVSETLFYPPDMCGLKILIEPFQTTFTKIDITPIVGSHSLGIGMENNIKPRFALTSIRGFF